MKTSLRLPVTLLLALLTMLGCLSLRASSGSDDNKKDLILSGLYRALAQATDPRDSVEIIFDMFDLLPSSRRPEMGATLYNLSKRYSEGAEPLDVLRMLTLMYKDNPYALQEILKEVESKQPSDKRDETVLYVNILQYAQQAGFSENKSFIKEELARMLYSENDDLPTDGPYDRLRRLFKMCMFTKAITEGSMLTERINEIDRELKRHKLSSWGIRRQFADMKQRIYTDNDEPEAAVEASRELIGILEGMKDSFYRQERKHMKLYWFRYRAYASILRNYRAKNVSADDIESTYTAINRLADSIPELRIEYDTHRYPDIYYLMARGEYAKALPLIRSAMNSEQGLMQRRFISHLMLQAARSINDSSLRLEADMIYIPLLKEYIQRKETESLDEMEVVHRVNEIRQQSVETEIELRRAMSHRRQMAIAAAIGAGVVLTGAIVVLAILFFRLRRTRRRLRRANRVLTARRNELRKSSEQLLLAVAASRKAEQSKSAFIKYISATISLPLSSIMEYSDKIIDGADENRRHFLRRFAAVMHDNSEQLKSIALRLQKLSRGDEFSTVKK